MFASRGERVLQDRRVPLASTLEARAESAGRVNEAATHTPFAARVTRTESYSVWPCYAWPVHLSLSRCIARPEQTRARAAPPTLASCTRSKGMRPAGTCFSADLNICPRRSSKISHRISHGARAPRSSPGPARRLGHAGPESGFIFLCRRPRTFNYTLPTL